MWSYLENRGYSAVNDGMGTINGKIGGESVPVGTKAGLIYGQETDSADAYAEMLDRYHTYGDSNSDLVTIHYVFDDPSATFTVEKGIINVTFEREYAQSGPLILQEIKGGSAFNVVPALASAHLQCEPAEAARILERYGEKDPKVQWEVIPEGLKVTAQGIQAHAASPEKGENAIGRLLAALAEQSIPGVGEKSVDKWHL